MSHLAADAGKSFGWEGMQDVPPFVEHDPATAGWTRRRDDPNVLARRMHLEAHAGIQGLEICRPDELQRAARLFRRDGFVPIADVMDSDQLAKMQAACTALVAEKVAGTPGMI